MRRLKDPLQRVCPNCGGDGLSVLGRTWAAVPACAWAAVTEVVIALGLALSARPSVGMSLVRLFRAGLLERMREEMPQGGYAYVYRRRPWFVGEPAPAGIERTGDEPRGLGSPR